MARILSLCSRLPYPLTGGAKLRMFYTARELTREHDVELLVVDEAPVDQSAVEALERIFDAVHVFTYPAYRFYVNTIPGVVPRRPLQTHYYRFGAVDEWLDKHEDRFDLLYCNHVRTSEYARGRETPYVVDLVDAISRNYRESSRDSTGIWRFIYPVEWRRLKRYERRVAQSSAHSFIITDEDREFVTDGESFPTLSVLPSGVKPELLDHTPGGYDPVKRDPTLVFLGKMDYFPNEDAAAYFATEILPTIRGEYPEVEFLVVGSSPSDRVRALGDEPRVTVTGFVEDPRDYLERADVVVTPMRHGAGMQNKVLEAMALARPVVTTSLAREGIDAVDDEHLVVADGAGAFADKTTELLDSRADRRRLGANARDLVTSKYTWSRVGQNLREAVAGVLERPT